uniref:SET domain-containing protein n=1 Tax=viral metagenome TaxID=1070528 RepID=A0A6C0L003_9ZZZZ|tara:strand:- start:1545 stop:1922 length:378 start_codon:yes stop_codon:yes gene_type:complete
MSFVDCSKVDVLKTEKKGMGAFANQAIQKDTLIEKGVMRRILCEGNKNPYLFTWSENRDVWAFASGCATFYNTSIQPNCKVVRDFENDIFEIYALSDIQKGEELTHKYKSLEWRECFKELHNEIQ